MIPHLWDRNVHAAVNSLVGFSLSVGLLAGVGVRVSEHWYSPTVHETVALALTVQFVVAKVHPIACRFAESNTQSDKKTITSWE
jgi:hypothetical protein